MFKLRTAVRPKLNQIGKPARRIVPFHEWFGRSDEDIADLIEFGFIPEIGGGAEANTNTVLANPVYFPRALVVSTDQTVLQGDLVWWDPVNYTLKQLTSPSAVAISSTGGYVGAAQGTNVPNVYPTPPSGISEDLPGVVVQRGGTVKLNSTTGDGSYFPFEPVTVGADQQTITRGGQTTSNRVGLIIVPPPVTARGAPGATPAPETVAGGSYVELWLEPKFPDTALL